MPIRKWAWIILPLFLLFAYVLTQFVTTSVRIKEWVDPLRPVPVTEAASKRVVLISQELDNPYWRSIGDSALAESKRVGLELDYVGPLRINAEEQLSLLEQAIASKADAILVQGTGLERSRALIDQAAEAGIPVLTLDADEPDSRRASYIGTDNREAGKQMGRLIAEAADGKAVVGVLIGTTASDSQKLRLEGLQSILSTYPGIRVAEVRTSNISRLQAASETRLMLEAHPAITDVVGLSSLDALGAMDAVESLKAEARTRIYAFDDLPDTRNAIEASKISLSLVQKPEQMGAEAIVITADLLRGISVPANRYTPVTVLAPSAAGTKGADSP
ncbi:substrate-binding domain-containing protein [Gorillibacterium timonense]|uniref:substrate-binding domain-containing protein n=1 Tax=Gorillibacterium timonense TaxID=1689269 RepID=UPI00071CD2D8|nr:substrate-binding domain-containing protein [Gorillibacterium timonense]